MIKAVEDHRSNVYRIIFVKMETWFEHRFSFLFDFIQEKMKKKKMFSKVHIFIFFGFVFYFFLLFHQKIV